MDQHRHNTSLESFCMVEICVLNRVRATAGAQPFLKCLQRYENRIDADFRSLVNYRG
jgi:hypothetical protein